MVPKLTVSSSEIMKHELIPLNVKAAKSSVLRVYLDMFSSISFLSIMGSFSMLSIFY